MTPTASGLDEALEAQTAAPTLSCKKCGGTIMSEMVWIPPREGPYHPECMGDLRRGQTWARLTEIPDDLVETVARAMQADFIIPPKRRPVEPFEPGYHRWETWWETAGRKHYSGLARAALSAAVAWLDEGAARLSQDGGSGAVSRRYAETTKVTVDVSQQAVKALLRKAGADQLAVYESPEVSKVAFRMEGRFYRISVPVKVGQPNAQQEERRAWRLMLLLIKAKLEAVREGASTIEREFLADMIMPDGSTVGEWTSEPLRVAYEKGEMPAALMLSGPRP